MPIEMPYFSTSALDALSDFAKVKTFPGNTTTKLSLGHIDNSIPQLYNCGMIPLFDNKGNLPPGIYTCMFAEIKEQFTYNQIREHLFGQLLVVVDILKQARCSEIYLDGSFITKKQFPNDFDLCWEPIGIQPTMRLKKLLSLDIDARREEFGGDVFVRIPEPPYRADPVRIWQSDKDGDAKGIIRILLEN